MGKYKDIAIDIANSKPKEDICIITGKDKYASSDDALKVIEYLSMTNNVILRPYYCNECHSWHLTKER
jgi:hypothetical protein